MVRCLICRLSFFFFAVALRPNAGHGLLILDVSRSHIQRRTAVGRTSLDEWSALRRDLYLTTHNTHNRQTSMPPVGFEPTISASERPQTYALDRADTGTGIAVNYYKLLIQTKEIIAIFFYLVDGRMRNLSLFKIWGFWKWLCFFCLFDELQTRCVWCK